MNKIMLVGEAWGKDEAAFGKPFVGPSGRLLKALLSQVGIPYDSCYPTNVFNLQPEPANDIKNLCGPKAMGIPGYPAVTAGKYIRVEFGPELIRLYSEIAATNPNLIIALGGTAMWALTHKAGIRNVRGTTTSTSPQASARIGRAVKILPTYHPAAVLREWALRPIVLADLSKAPHESAFPEVRRPERQVWIEPTIEDLYAFEQKYITQSCVLSIDVETKGNQITCFGVAPDESHALVIPFRSRDGRSYWSVGDEIAMLRWIRSLCARPNAKLGQNFLYDLRFIWERYGIPVLAFEHDTMLLHHALQPEMDKGLGFLGSLYTNEASWKFMRKVSETIKKED